jgi:hypothetical protein
LQPRQAANGHPAKLVCVESGRCLSFWPTTVPVDRRRTGALCYASRPIISAPLASRFFADLVADRTLNGGDGMVSFADNQQGT